MEEFLSKLLIHTIMVILYIGIYKLNSFEAAVVIALANILALIITKELS